MKSHTVQKVKKRERDSYLAMASRLKALLLNKKETGAIENIIDNLSSTDSDSFNCSLDSSGDQSSTFAPNTNSKKPFSTDYSQENDNKPAGYQRSTTPEMQGEFGKPLNTNEYY